MQLQNNPPLIEPKAEPLSAAVATTATMVTPDATENDVKLFGKYVEQRLCRQTDDLKRRRLESAIQEAIAKTEKELFE